MRAIIFFLLVFCIGSCNRAKDPLDRIYDKLELSNTEGLQKHIPEPFKESTLSGRFIRKRNSLDKLPSIENGTEFLEIRIREEFGWGGAVFVIRFKESMWTAEGHMYQVFDRGSGIDSSVVDIVPFGNPKSGWTKFMNKLIDKGILGLKDESEIQGYSTWSEFSYIAVEIAAKNYYKYYSLPSAREVNSKIKEDKVMLEILELLEHEFPALWPTISKYSEARNK